MSMSDLLNSAKTATFRLVLTRRSNVKIKVDGLCFSEVQLCYYRVVLKFKFNIFQLLLEVQ